MTVGVGKESSQNQCGHDPPVAATLPAAINDPHVTTWIHRNVCGMDGNYGIAFGPRYGRIDKHPGLVTWLAPIPVYVTGTGQRLSVCAIEKNYQQTNINRKLCSVERWVPRQGNLYNTQVDMKPKDKLKAMAQKPAFWLVVGVLLVAAGVNIPPQILDALQILGPLLAF